MTNEMQLAHAAGLPATGHEMAPGHGNHQQSQQTGFKRVHKLLRGRYPLVITLGLLFGIAGGLTGYLTQKPQFSSGFQIEINPIVHMPGNPMGDPMLGYDRFLQSQVAVIRSYELIQRALDEDDWKNADGARRRGVCWCSSAMDWTRRIIPRKRRSSRVSYSNPDRDLAFAGAVSVLKAYTQFMLDSDPMGVGSNLQEIDKMRTKYSNDLLSYQERLHDYQNEFNTDDLSTYQAQNMNELGQLEGALTNAKMQLNIDLGLLSQSQAGGVDAQGNPNQPVPGQVDGGPDRGGRRR